MRFTKRDMKMIEYLKNYEMVDLDSMADYLELSPKSLKNQLKVLAETIKDFEITFCFLPGNQMRIEGTDRFPEMISMSLPRFEIDYEKKFLLLLVLHNDFLIIQDIADRLLVSKSYAEKRLAPIIKKYFGDIQVLRHYGVRYVAPQMKRRETFVRILFPYLFGEDYGYALRQFHHLHFPILDYFNEEQILNARIASRSIINMKWFRITDESVQVVFLYILFLIRSSEIGYREELGERQDFKKDFDATEEFEGLYEWLRDRMHEWNLPESEAEVCYLYNLLLSLQKQEIFCQEQVMAKMSAPVEAILQGVHERIGVDLCQDEELIQGLAAHLYTTVFRENSLRPSFDRLLVKALKRQYPLGFDMAAVAVDYIRDMYRLSVTKGDTVSLAIHFQAALERLGIKKEFPEIVIICHLGKAAGSIIRSKLERKIGDIQVLGSYSLQEYQQGHVPKCDCIVTTERMIQTETPVIYVTLALPDSEIKKVAEGVRSIQYYRYLEQITLQSMILHIDAVDIPGILEEMVRPLVEEGFVEETYLQSVLDRENISSTSLRYVALPHGNPLFVNSMKLVVARLSQPVLWDNEYIYYVFLFATPMKLMDEKLSLYCVLHQTFSTLDVEEKLNRLQKQNLSDEAFKQMLFHILR